MMVFLSFFFKTVLITALILLREGYLYPDFIAFVGKSSMLNAFLGFLIFWLGLNLSIRFSQFIYRTRKKQGRKYSDNVIIGLKNIYYLLTVMALVAMFFGFFGLHIKELFTALSIVAAAIAIISKELVLDVICGINFSFSRDIAIGDYVQIGDQQGRVVDLNIHKIVLFENDQLINIPNSKAYFSDIANYSYGEMHVCRFQLELPNQFVIKLEALKTIILESAKQCQGGERINDIEVRIDQLRADHTVFSVELRYLDAIRNISVPRIRSRVYEVILARDQVKR
ncbi:MAG: mechanosensitive ion channel [Saprospiraceae bacterium]|nr:mechanosensitive ion channel [Saprospiraceae bacterium]